MKEHLLLIVSTLFLITACKNNEQTSPSSGDLAIIKQDSLDKRNKQIALGCIHAFDSGDLDYIISHHAKDHVNYGEGKPVRGIDPTTTELRKVRSMLKEWKSSNELAVADNNYVFVYQNFDASLKADPTGKTHHFRAVEIFKFNEDGKIIQHTAVQKELLPNQEDYFAKEQAH